MAEHFPTRSMAYLKTYKNSLETEYLKYGRIAFSKTATEEEKHQCYPVLDSIRLCIIAIEEEIQRRYGLGIENPEGWCDEEDDGIQQFDSWYCLCKNCSKDSYWYRSKSSDFLFEFMHALWEESIVNQEHFECPQLREYINNPDQSYMCRDAIYEVSREMFRRKQKYE